MNQNGNRGRVPRRTTIADQDHMLAYITPAEALMLRRNGGSGQPGPGGIPAYARDLRYQTADDQFRAENPTLGGKTIDDDNTISSTGYYDRKREAKDAQKAKAADAAKQNVNKPRFGYGYFMKDEQGKDTDVWVPPSIDMRDGGGRGIAGYYFGSSGGVKADEDGNNNNYVDKDEFENDSMKQGFGRVSNAIKATPLFSGRKPEGIAKFFQTGGLMGNLMGLEPPKIRKNLQGQYTQEDINQYVRKQAELAQDASYRAATMQTSLDDEPGFNYVDPNAVTGDVIEQFDPIGGDTVVPQTNYITGTGIVPSNAFGMQNFNQQPYPQLGMARPALTYAELLAGYTNPYGNKPAGVV